MNNAKVAEFSTRYMCLTEWELADLDARRSSLTEEACIALDAVLANRTIDLKKVRQIEAEEETKQAALEVRKVGKRQTRDARVIKIFLVVGIPIIIFGALFRPERFLETLVSTGVQVVFLGFIYWGYLRWKRSKK